MSRMHNRQRGMTLVELMVALTVGLFLALGITGVIVQSLRQQTITGSVNARDQAVTAALSQLDHYVRSAGSGFSNGWKLGFFGCHLQAAKDGVVLLPATLAAPFDHVTALAAPVMAPLIIEAGVGANGSDVLFVMGGNGAYSNVPRLVSQAAGNTLNFENVIGLASKDVLVVAAEGKQDCYLSQIDSVQAGSGGASEGSGTPNSVTLGGNYYLASRDGAESLETIAATSPAFIAPLGGTAAAYPAMRLLGVGEGDVLFQYDLLNLKGKTPQAITEGVSHLMAVYGVDTDEDGKVDSWVSPSASGWTATEVMASSLKIRQILAVRLAVIARSQGVNQANVSPATLQAFASLGDSLKREVSLSSTQRSQRYRVMEIVIPVRNNLQIDS